MLQDPRFVAARLKAVERVRRWEAKQRRKRSGDEKPAFNWTALRCRELESVLTDRYGAHLPNDDAGREDLRIMARHLAHRGDEHGIRLWAMKHAPWLDDHERESVVRRAMASTAKLPMADTLAKQLGLTYADRQRLRLTTIGAVDVDKDERLARRKARKAQRRREKRHQQGMKPRAASLSRIKPWVAEGVSRRTWYRRRGTTMTPSKESEALLGVRLVPPRKRLAPSSAPKARRASVLARRHVR